MVNAQTVPATVPGAAPVAALRKCCTRGGPRRRPLARCRLRCPPGATVGGARCRAGSAHRQHRHCRCLYTTWRKVRGTVTLFIEEADRLVTSDPSSKGQEDLGLAVYCQPSPLVHRLSPMSSTALVPAASRDSTLLRRQGMGAVIRAQICCHSWLLTAPAGIGSQAGEEGSCRLSDCRLSST